MNFQLMILATAATLSLAAQELHKPISANVWFPFQISGVAMPAGKYSVVRDDRMPILTIRDANTHKSVMVVTTGMGGNQYGTTKLTFHRHGNSYFLRSVTDGVSGLVVEVPISRRAKEIAATSKPEVIVAVAR